MAIAAHTKSLYQVASSVRPVQNLRVQTIPCKNEGCVIVGPRCWLVQSIAYKFAVDVSHRLSNKWNVPFSAILNVTDLRVYLNEPLNPEDKIPIPDEEWQRLLQPNLSLHRHLCSSEDLGVLFTKNEDETASFIWHKVWCAIIEDPPDSSGTEDSFHYFWDLNILRILLTCLGNFTWVRNSNKGTHTGSLRPDLGVLLEFACVFRGEEKRPTFTGKHPRQELIDKTRWVYDPAPYVLGV
jgi:hypothetical protein